MPIAVGNILKFQLQESISGVLSDVAGFSEVEVVRKEFNAEEFSGVGYQRVLIQDNYGSLGSHGIGQSVGENSLQVVAKALALPLYRFDFALVLDNQKLKEVYELFLALYNLRAEGRNVRLKMTDNKLRISEPLDSFDSNARSGTNINTNLTTQADIQYQLKTVEYQITWENFEWRHKVGDIYDVNIFGTELEVITDINQGNTCEGAESEEIDFIDGFELSRIFLPTTFDNALVAYDCFGIGLLPSNAALPDFYLAHWLIDGEHLFMAWDGSAAGLSAVQTFNFDTEWLNDFWLGDTGPINTKVLPDRIQFIDSDPENTAYFLREYNPNNVKTPGFLLGEEAGIVTLHGTFAATNVSEYQYFLDNEDSRTTYLLPRLINSGPAITTATNGNDIEQFSFQATDTPDNFRRISLPDWAVLENESEARLTGSTAVTETGVNLSAIPNSSTGSTSTGWFWYEKQINMGASTRIVVDFEFEITDGLGTHGFTFILHNDERGIEHEWNEAVLSNIGFGGLFLFGGTYFEPYSIHPSLAIVFDTSADGTFPMAYEGTTGTALPHHLHVIRDGRVDTIPAVDPGTGRLVNNLAIGDIRGQRLQVTIDYGRIANQIEVRIRPPGTSILPYTFTGIDYGSFVGSEAWVGFTTSAAAGQSHEIKNWSLRHDSTFRIPDTTLSFPASYMEFDLPAQQLVNKYHTEMGEEIDHVFRDVVTVRSPIEGTTQYYHICHDPSDPNICAIYRTIGPDFFGSRRSLIQSFTDGTIPVLKNAIAHPTEYKFYLTQGSDTGNVYWTDNWVDYNLIGSWTEKDAGITNEGQLAFYRNRYLVRNPSRFVIDVRTDTFVDLQTLLCASSSGTLVDTKIFGAGREVIATLPTADYNKDYVDNGNEQIIICSRDSVSDNDVWCAKLQALESCS